MLRNYIDEGHCNWEDMLNKVAFAYRASVHAFTLESSFFLIRGIDSVIAVDYVLDFKKWRISYDPRKFF